MRIKPTTGSVVGKTDANHWGQVLLTPNLYGVVEIDDPEGAARVAGLRVLSSVTRGTNDVRSLADLATILHASAEPSVKTLILLSPVGTVVYIAVAGTGAVFLKRGDQLATLVRDEGSISGELKSGDTLLLASAGFTASLSDAELANTFDHLPAAEVAEQLTLAIHEKTDVTGAAALIVQISGVESDEVAPAVEEVSTVTQPAPSVFSARRRTRIRQKVKQTVGHLITIKNAKLAAAGLIGLVFVVSIMLGVVRERSRGTSQQITVTLTQAQYAFDEGVALLALNPVKGRERLMEAKTMLDPLVSSVSAKTKEGRQVAALYQKITDNLTTAMAVTTVEPELFFDVSLLKKGGLASRIALFSDELGIADSATNTLYTVAIPSKNGQVVAGGQGLARPIDVSVYGDNLYSLTESGITRVGLIDKKVTADMVKKDKEWGTISSFVSFTGNMYLLDTQKSRIWKYVATDKGFSELREYLNPDTLPDLSGATSMAIDGSVWVGTSTGKVVRFTQGRENTFVIKGLEPGLGNAIFVYTDDGSDHVYVLDADNKRVAVLDKEGTYVAQYTWQGNITPTQLVVSEKLKKVLLLVDGKIYSIGLR